MLYSYGELCDVVLQLQKKVVMLEVKLKRKRVFGTAMYSRSSACLEVDVLLKLAGGACFPSLLARRLGWRREFLYVVLDRLVRGGFVEKFGGVAKGGGRLGDCRVVFYGLTLEGKVIVDCLQGNNVVTVETKPTEKI